MNTHTFKGKERGVDHNNGVNVLNSWVYLLQEDIECKSSIMYYNTGMNVYACSPVHYFNAANGFTLEDDLSFKR